MPDTHWTPIPGCPDYEINTRGEVKSLKGRAERLLAGTMTLSGPRVDLTTTTGRNKSYVVARLVLTIFAPIPFSNRYRAVFKDGDSRNVTLSNLEWRLAPRTKLTAEDVQAIRRLYKADLSLSCAKIAKVYGVTASTIKAAIAGTTWTDIGDEVQACS